MNLNWLIPAKGGPMSQPASRKIYVTGSRPDLRVPVREVCLHGGEPPLRLYDTAGPWTDLDAHPDIKLGLPPLRLPWIAGRGDVAELPGPTRSGGGRRRPTGASATTTRRWVASASPRSAARCAPARAASSPRCTT